ncbi:MAG: hypothetical protein ACYDC6_00630 [Acidobacteriaceae bacterium]
MMQPRKPSPTESPLLFEIDDEPLQETLTAWGGVPLVVQAFRSLGVLTALKRIALPAELLRARPKRLHLATLEERIALWKKALRLLPVAT